MKSRWVPLGQLPAEAKRQEAEAAERKPLTHGPQSNAPLVDTPVATEHTPAIPDHVQDGPNFRRMTAAIAAGNFPVEPDLKPISPKRAEESLRDLTAFSIISRLLYKNCKNVEITEALASAGFPMSERSLQRIFKRSDFIEYYERYRNQLLEPLDRQIRDDLRLSMPEAFNRLIMLMRSAKSEKVKYDSIISVLQGGGGLKKETNVRTVNINVPPDVQRLLVEKGLLLAGGDVRLLEDDLLGDESPDASRTGEPDSQPN